MRTIKFRGKSRHEDVWYYGGIFQTGADCFVVKRGNWEPYLICNIDPNTVGQFTGLCDKKGNAIYEGDILRISDFANVECVFRHGAFGYIYCKDFHSFAGNTNYTFNPKNTDKDFEIIGNIYDNPELLKGGEK